MLAAWAMVLQAESANMATIKTAVEIIDDFFILNLLD
jgi:hypothetical protein